MYDKSNMSETTLFKELTILLNDLVERIVYRLSGTCYLLLLPCGISAVECINLFLFYFLIASKILAQKGEMDYYFIIV